MSPAPNFNHLARPYRWLEYFTFGPFLQRCRTHFVPHLAHCRRALVLGDGDGRFTARLLCSNPRIRITAVDASPCMIESLQRTAKPNLDRLTTRVADLRTWHPASPEQYDLIVTHFFLDCLTTQEVADLASRLAPSITASAPSALWVVSEFAIPPTVFGRAIAAPLVVCLYFAFRWLTGLRVQSLPDHFGALAAAGWTLEMQHTHLRGLLISQLWCYSNLRY